MKYPGLPAPPVPSSVPGVTAADPLYSLTLKAFWAQMKRESFSFWMICAYLFVEYVRPQSILPWLDFLPWAQVTLLLALLGLFAEREKKWVSDPANLFMLLFQLVIVLSSFLAVYPAISWLHFSDFFNWLIIYFLVINIVRTERRLLIFIAIFMIASFKLSLFGARTWMVRGFSFTTWGIQGPPGFFTNSGELSIQMLVYGPLAYYLAIFFRPHISKTKFYLLLLMPVTAAMTVIGASSRGAQLALGYQSYRTLLKGRTSVKTIIVAVAAIWIAVSLIPAEQKARFTALGDDRTSQQRLLYWKHGLEMIHDHPVLGIGYFNFQKYYQEHHSDDLLYPEAQLPHNIFIQVGTDAGALGLICLIALMFRTAQIARRIRGHSTSHSLVGRPLLPIANGLLVAMWGFVIAGQFVTVTYYPFFWMNLAMMVCVSNIARKTVQDISGQASTQETPATERVPGAFPAGVS
jgi:O-antigen ligase